MGQTDYKQICELIGQASPGMADVCHDFLYNNGPGIINSIVHENLNPQEVCTGLSVCP